MEVTRRSESDEMLNRKQATIVGALTLLGALVAVALLVARMPKGEDPMSAAMIGSAAGIALAGAIALCGVFLMQQRIWAHRTMLIFWLATTASGVLAGTSAMVWEQWWRKTAVESIGSTAAWAIVGCAVVVGVLMVAMLISASSSRLRYASIMSLAAAAAIALAVTVNVISQRDYYRLPVESLGRYSISQRTEKILADLDQPVRLTCVYMGSSEGKTGSDFRPRVWELLEDLSEKAEKLGKRIEIASVTTDAQRKAEDIRLGAKQRIRKGASHDKFLRNFQADAAEIAQQLKTQQAIWRDLGEKSYLAQWPIPAQLAIRLSRLVEGFDRTRIKLRSEMQREGIRNYPAMIAPAKSMLKTTLTTLHGYRATLAALEQVHLGAVKNRTDILEAVAQSLRDVDKLRQTVGKPGDPAPADPSAVLKEFIQAAAKASASCYKATAALETLAGKEHATLVVNSSHWVVKIEKDKVSLSEFFGTMAKRFLQTARELQQISHRWTIESKIKGVVGLRTQLESVRRKFALAQTATEKALAALVDPDPKSRRIMQDASSNRLFEALIARLESLSKQGDKLPPVKATSLGKDLAGDNIVIVEAGEKTEVVAFDEVWPMGMRADSKGRPQRVFNGDSAIASRICSMTNEPFATVVLAYVQPTDTPEMKKKRQTFASPTVQYKILRARLKTANFKVLDWEITKSFDEAFKTSETTPALKNVVLLVLPSTKLSEITAERMTNLRREIDTGTPAVFLTESQIKPTDDTPYDREMTKYLAAEWGVAVLSNYVTIPAVRDTVDPTRFKIDNLLTRSMPQSNFSDHVIAKGLKGQRLLWRSLSACPVAKIIDPKTPGRTVTSLLTIPGEQTSTWATTRFLELQKQYRKTEGSFIRPDFDAKESPAIKPPFDLALTAERQAGAASKTNRIVVIGVGASLVDSYLGASVEVHAADRTTSMADPPEMDADLVVNSVHWLGGLEDRIAAGPAVSQPIDVKPHTRDLLMIACTIGLPLGVLLVGGGVMLMRKRR